MQLNIAGSVLNSLHVKCCVGHPQFLCATAQGFQVNSVQPLGLTSNMQYFAYSL